GTNWFASGATYWPQGALNTATYGSATSSTGLNRLDTYNKRLQPLDMIAQKGTPDPTCVMSSGKLLHLSYGFGYGANDNGNVVSIQNCRNYGRSSSFTYDELNRLKTAQSAATSGTDAWGESFAYDAWGNLLNRGIINVAGELF